MSDEREPHWWVQTDEEVLAEAVQVQLEREADQLVAALLAADAAARLALPDLISELDRNAAQYGEARRTWEADMACGDLPPDERALAKAAELRRNAGAQMYAMLCTGREINSPLVQPVIDAMMALYQFENALNDDNRDLIMEYIACELGEVGPRYVLGY